MQYNKSIPSGLEKLVCYERREDPSLVNGLKNPRLNLLLRGMKRDSAARARRIRKPLDIGKLEKVAAAFDMLDIPLFEKLRAKAACLLAFWGFLRSVDYCVTLRRKDVKFGIMQDGRMCILLILNKSKTQQFGKTKIYIYPNESPLCAVRALISYFRLTAWYKCNLDAPIFAIPSSPFTATFFNGLLKMAVNSAGLNPKHYSSHSLRSGAATTAANTGVPPYLIKKLGRWSSNAFQIYIGEPKAALERAHLHMLR
jgi:hypothetical protein